MPATVDRTTGYRCYGADQIPTGQVVHRLRELDVPVLEVQEIVLAADPVARATVVAQHLRRLEAELERKRAAVVALRRLLDPQPAPIDVVLRAVPAVTAAAVADEDVLSWYAGAAELAASVAEPDGAPGGMYDDALFQHGRGRALVYVPTPRPPHRGRVHPVTLPAAELAVATHTGPHDDIGVTYDELGAWVVANALRVTGPVRETYLVGPRDTDDPAAWRTEIGWPVCALSAPTTPRA